MTLVIVNFLQNFMNISLGIMGNNTSLNSLIKYQYVCEAVT